MSSSIRTCSVTGAIALLALSALLAAPPSTGLGQVPDRCLVPAPLRAALLNEISGENAANHVQILAVNRDRQPNEYLDTYFETLYIRDRLQEYGLADVRVDYFPSGDVWDAEEGSSR